MAIAVVAFVPGCIAAVMAMMHGDDDTRVYTALAIFPLPFISLAAFTAIRRRRQEPNQRSL